MENQTGVEAEVEFTYEAVNSDELDLRAGHIVKNIVIMDGGWWEGENNGKRGMFPDNFVKIIEKKKDEPRAEASSTKSKAPGPPVNGEVHHAKETATSSNTAGVNLRENKPSRENRARVTYSYVPMNEDELKLLPNDVITNVVIVEEGWCEGSLHGRRGMFPSNFVSIIAEEQEPMEAVASRNDTSMSSQPVATVNKIDPTASSSISNAPSTPTNVHSKPVKLPGAIGFGVDIFKDAKPLRKRESGPLKSSEVKNDTYLELMKKRNSLKKSTVTLEELAVPLKPEKIAEEPPKPVKTEAKSVRKAKVVYDYQPENTDELGLKEGDIVTILDKESVDSGWWYGECHGKQGMFPDNFVVPLPQEPERPRKDSVPLRPPAPNKPHNRPPSIEVKSSSIHKPLPPVKSPLDLSAPPMSPLKPPIKHDDPSKPATGPARPLKAAQRKPPPIKNKPAASKSVPVLPITVKETEKKPVAMSYSSELQFDDIKSNNKLNHPNLSRPKTPNKRPPSLFGAKNIDGLTEELNSSHSSSLTVPKSKAQMTTVAPSQPEKQNEESFPSPSHRERDMRASRDHELTSDTSNEQELKNEIKSLKETMKKSMKDMKDMMTSMRADLRKEMKSLMEEVDEEKKLRMNMQVELDRMKKLVYDKI